MKIAGVFIFPVMLISLLRLFTAVPAILGATFTVCSSGCDYASINVAAAAVPTGSVIEVAAETFVENVVVSRSMTIQGQGEGATIVDGGTLNGGSVFEISPGAIVEISGLTIQNGSSPNGGGIVNDGTITITNALIQNNESPCDDGGGVVNFGVMTLQEVTIQNNSAATGAGIFNDGLIIGDHITITHNSTIPDSCSDSGGGIENAGQIDLMRSVISHNEAAGDGGGVENAGTITMTTISIHDNSSLNWGGGLDNVPGSVATILQSVFYNNQAVSGGGLYNDVNAMMAVTNSTISGNNATQGGGVNNEGLGATAVFHSSTFYNNSGGGIRNLAGTVTLGNTIIAHFVALEFGADCHGEGIISDGFNLDSDDNCGLGANEWAGIVNPGLGPLQDNGGPTWTHALLPASPAIDVSAACEPTDQRGFPRPDGVACDIGAFETSVLRVYLPAMLRD